MKMSVVIPVYGCPEAVAPLCSRLVDTLTQLTPDFEIFLVNDACPLDSWSQVEAACARDERIKGVALSRNFGQISAITAGLDLCTGDWIVVMDCDLQDRPEGILELYAKAQEGYDVVFARRADRKDSGVTRFLSRMFYRVYDYFTDGASDSAIGNFSISRRAVIRNYLRMRDQNHDYMLLLRWLGYRQTAIDIQADPRYAGESSYNFKRKLALAARFITAQSNKPLMLSVRAGFLCAFLALVYIVYRVIVYFVTGQVPTGWTSLIASLYLLGGLILISNGVLGIYIGYIFNEVKGRPLYVIRTTRNLPPPPDTIPDAEPADAAR